MNENHLRAGRLTLLGLLVALPFQLRAQTASAPREAGRDVPVDYAALVKEGQAVMGQVQASFKAHLDSGTKEPFKADPKVLDPLRARARAASGDLKEALMVQEVLLSAQIQVPSTFKDQVMKEVQPASRAWKVSPDMAVYLPMIFGEAGTAYVAAMRREGIAEVRGALLTGDVQTHLGPARNLEAARAAQAQAEALAPDSLLVKQSGLMLQGEMKTTLGQAAPDFKVSDLEHPDRFHTLADFKGRFLLLDFWGTWCGWCVKELPTTHKVYEKFHGRGLEILSVAREAKAETVQAFRKKPESPMPWKHALLKGSKDQQDPMVEAFGVMGFPSLYLIGPDGKLLAKGDELREDSLEKTLLRFIK